MIPLLLTLSLLNPWGGPDPNSDSDWRSFWAQRLALTRQEVEPVRTEAPLVIVPDAPVATTTTAPAPPPHPCDTHQDHKPGTLAMCPLIAPWFDPEDLEWALNIVDCESNGVPTARNPGSGAGGLFQIMPGWEPKMVQIVGSSDRFDPTVNAQFAAWLFYHGGGAPHWVCKGG